MHQQSPTVVCNVPCGRRRLWDKEHRKTWDIICHLGLPYRELERYDEAERLGVSALETNHRLFGEEDQATLRSMVDVAKLYRDQGHHRDWLAACKGGPAASSDFEYGAKLVELVLLGVVSLRTGKKLYWDAVNMKARGLAAADEFIKEPYRKGWEIV